MQKMTSKERISNILRRRPVDRIGLYEHFWGNTQDLWIEQGHMKSLDDLPFPFDITECWAANYSVDPDFKDEIVEEDEDTRLYRNGNGALLRRHKRNNTTPEHVGYTITNRREWEERAKPRLTPAPGRLKFEEYRQTRRKAEDRGLFFVHSGVNVFEAVHPLIGHENMLLGMALDPDWFLDMADTYSDLMIKLMEILFAAEGKPDGIWFYEDMGYRGHPFISPEMYDELILPAHQKTIDFAHSLGLPVIMHSCGYVEPLIPGIIRAGVDCLQVIEIKAGMDLLKIKREYGDKLVLFGGFDARNLVANDIAAIDREIEEKIPEVMKDYGYILHSDHSIPPQCRYETYQHFVTRALTAGTYGE